MIQQQQHFFDSKLNYSQQQIETSDSSASDKSILSIRNTSDLNNNDNYFIEKLHEKADMKQEPIAEVLIDTKKQYQRVKKTQLVKAVSNENTENSYGSDENESYQYQSPLFMPNKFYSQNEIQSQIYPWMKDSRHQNLNNFSPNSQNTTIQSLPISAISPNKNTTSQNFNNQSISKNEISNSTIHSIGSSSSPNTSNPSDSLLTTPAAGAKSTTSMFFKFFIMIGRQIVNRANLKVISKSMLLL